MIRGLQFGTATQVVADCACVQQLTAVNAQVLLQVVFVFEGLGTLGALELASSTCSYRSSC